MNKFVKALHSGRVLVMDGAMGTELQRATGALGGEALNLSRPEIVCQVHRSYLDAGAEVLLTNTLQANPVTLGESHQAIWRAAIDLAREDDRLHFVVADIGPITNLTDDIAATMLRDCAGVDAVLLETWSSVDDLETFARIATVPLMVSFTFAHDWLADDRVEVFARAAKRNGVIALGANCGKEIDMADMLAIVRRYRAVCDLPIFVRPNAGTPTLMDGKWVYPRTPQGMAAELPALMEAGIAMIGGCCGTTPEHVRAFRGVLV
jgi:5-methyltetrahydrofolate--homocysteine methyltransferase